MTFRGRLLLLGLLASGACASRSAPSYPRDAASSAHAPEGKPANVTLALTSEPPQPGDPVGAWRGLAETAGGEADSSADSPAPGPAADPHAGHGHHGGHDHGAH